MTDFKKEYNDFYSNIKASKKLKNSIMDNTVNKVKVKRSLLFRICLSASCFILAIAIIGISYVSAEQLGNVIQKYFITRTLTETAEESETGEDIYSCKVNPPVNNVINTNSNFDEGTQTISAADAEKELGIHLLNNEQLLDKEYKIKEVIRENNMISYVRLENGEDDSEYFNDIKLSASILTTNASKTVIENKYLFEKYGCAENNFEKITTKNGIDVYFYLTPMEVTGKGPNWSERPMGHMPAFFIHDGVAYRIVYNSIVREKVIEFVESLS